MTFSTAHSAPVQAQFRENSDNFLDESIPQSKETGVVLPDLPNNVSAVTEKAAPVYKPWAHFVAGAYVKKNRKRKYRYADIHPAPAG